MSPSILAAAFACSAIGVGCSSTHAGAKELAIANDDLRGHQRQGRVAVYTSEGASLHAHSLDGHTGQLVLTSTAVLPEQVHYAVADAKSEVLYVSSSNGSNNHWLHAFSIDPKTAELAQLGPPLVPPGGRIIHLSIDRRSEYLIMAHNQTSQLASVRLNADRSLGEIVSQPQATNTGFFTHQALMDDAGTNVVACGLGAMATAGAPEQPGSLSVFRYHDGLLTPTQTISPGPGLGPRHLDYGAEHVYVAVERGNRLFAYPYAAGVLEEAPEFDVPTLMDPSNVRPRQRAGAIDVDPGGKYLYLSNRADQNVNVSLDGREVDVFAGGENNIALFELDARTGSPRLVDHYDTRGIEPRTFAIEPGGRFLIVGNQSARNVLDNRGAVEAVPRSVAVFRIGKSGRLAYLHKYDVARGDVFWVGAVKLPG